MKKIMVILLLLFPGLFAGAVGLNVQLSLSRSINKKYHQTVKNAVLYWVRAKTVYSVNKNAGLTLYVNLKQKLSKYILEASLRRGNTIINEGHFNFYKMVDFFDALDHVFYNRIFKCRLVKYKRRYMVRPRAIDIGFVIDSTGSMAEEIEFFRHNSRNIFSNIFWNLKTYYIRMAFLDYKNTSGPYRINFINFSSKTESIMQRLDVINPVGKGIKSDINYALLYMLTYGDFIASRRIIFVITDSGPVSKKKFVAIMKKAARMKVRVYILAGDGISHSAANFYRKICRRFRGKFFHLTYLLTYILRNYTLRRFQYRYRYIWEIEGKKKTDITLGRKILNIRRLYSFLEREGFPLAYLKKTYINLGRIFSQITSRYRRKIPIGVFRSHGNTILFGVQDRQTYRILKRLKKRNIILSGHFFPYFNKVSIFPYTVFVKTARKVPYPLLQDINSIIKNPFFYFDKGLFEPSLWYIRGRFLGFK